ncbi:MAG: hypothetical protein NT126_04085 [Bacteroidetes bacterium]|nr:hypothetical protein [Bacteroidota bacterium]
MNSPRIFFVIVFVFLLQKQAWPQHAPVSEEQFKSYFQQHRDSLDQIEGIWNVNTVQEYYRYDTLYEVDKIPKSVKVAIIKKDNRYESFNLSGESYDVQFTSSEINGVYFYRNFFKETNEYSKANAVISKAGEMEYNYDFPDNYLQKKLGESYEEGTRVVNKTRWIKIFPDRKK